MDIDTVRSPRGGTVFRYRPFEEANDPPHARVTASARDHPAA
jgi:hypothetical protein